MLPKVDKETNDADLSENVNILEVTMIMERKTNVYLVLMVTGLLHFYSINDV